MYTQIDTVHTPTPLVYRLILADLDSSFKALSHCFKQPLSANLDDEEAAFNPIDAQVCGKCGNFMCNLVSVTLAS